MRKRIFEIIEKAEGKDIVSMIYDIFMLITIFVSLAPIMAKTQNQTLIIIDYVCVAIFIVDYLLRWMTADYKLGKKLSILVYPVTPFAIIDLLAILPSFTALSPAFRIFKILRVFRAMRVFKTLRYSKNFIMISNVIKKNASMLLSLFACAIFYIFVSALFIFTIEPDCFDNFFEALYWATTALTTVGYGDVYPLTNGGRVISMLSSFFGIAMVALPSGVITAGFIEEINIQKENEKKI